MGVGRRALCLVSILALAACSGRDTIVLKTAPKLRADCHIDIYEVAEDVKRTYEKLCMVSVLEENLKEASEEASKKACRCGASAVILMGGPQFVDKKKLALNVVAIRYTNADAPPKAP